MAFQYKFFYNYIKFIANIGASALSMMTFLITTLSIKGFYVTLSISDTQHK
jgi:hypothetical protein